MEHGKCISVKMIMHTAVFIVHPLLLSTDISSFAADASVIAGQLWYIIRIIGSTISLAGKPSKKPERIAPSSPISLPAGSRNSDRYIISDLFSISKCASIQMTAPAGAATITALPRIKTVLSKIERIG